MRRSPTLIILPVLIFLLAIVIFPLIYGFFISFTNLSFRNPESGALVGVDNYTSLLLNGDFQWAVARTLIFSALSIGISSLIAFGLALLFYFYKPIGVSSFMTAFLIPVTIAPIVIGLDFRFMYNTDIGLLQYVIRSLGFGTVNFLSGELGLFSIVASDVWEWTPFVFAILLISLESMPTEPLEAAVLDGSSTGQLIRHIMTPELKTPFAAVTLIRLMDSLREFDKVYVMTQGGPGTSTELISVFLWRTGFVYLDIAKATAMALVFLFVIEFVCTIYLKLVKMEK
jgi:multiple sugar transport system permease protein